MNQSTAASINERAAEEFFRKAQESEKDGNQEKAIDFYERALSENPDHEIACFQLAVLYDRRSEDSKAIELYERICTSEPVHVNALMNLAVLYEDNNLYDDARRCLNAVLRTNYNHPRAGLYMKDVESARSMFFDEDERSKNNRNITLDIPISDFELSVRSRNCLKKMDIKSLGDLLRVSEQELLSFKNFGETSLNEIKQLLQAKGLRLGQAAEMALNSLTSGSSSMGAATTAGVAAAPRRATGGTDFAAEVYAKSVNDMELSVRSRKALQRLNIQTLGDLAQRTEEELLGCKNFGHTSLNEIKQILAQNGVGLRKLEV
ncbi:MAG TPA: DNA-directed RNA polymerase subunit alpha C-terminal domain-containing protein [Tepidisphaeraceae bacterium]|jgi:DNA-directed RNA polymerase subunit alpha